mmetsp:Transcript_62402/g.135230  ORF Transcript_62402/g.135230 Transcript_62402/m.135230 type:complete len:304 (+) Transcript_62402:918-1829(+)
MQAGFRRRRSLRSLVVAAKLMRFGSGCHWEHSGSSVSASRSCSAASGHLRSTAARSSTRQSSPPVPSTSRASRATPPGSASPTSCRKRGMQYGSCVMKIRRETEVFGASSASSCSRSQPVLMPTSSGTGRPGLLVSAAACISGSSARRWPRTSSMRPRLGVEKATWSGDSPSSFSLIVALLSTRRRTTPSVPPRPSARTAAWSASSWSTPPRVRQEPTLAPRSSSSRTSATLPRLAAMCRASAVPCSRPSRLRYRKRTETCVQSASRIRRTSSTARPSSSSMSMSTALWIAPPVHSQSFHMKR